MISTKINNKKIFMSKLLASELFDDFMVEEAEITTFNTFHIDGKIHKDFYKDNSGDLSDNNINSKEYSDWRDLKSTCFDLIKGKHTPLSFKFIFYLSNNEKAKLLSKADAGIDESQVKLGLNIRFFNGEILLTTGCAINIFTLDKTIEKAWDEYIPSFLASNGIDTEEYI
jgi:hypothetical protein